jgi:histidinol-phosphatase (PHP family)
MTTDELVKQFEAFVEEACRLRDAHEKSGDGTGLSLLVGCETEVIDDASLDQLSALLDSHKDHIDYVVGSVHHVHGIPLDLDRATYTRCLTSCQSSLSTYLLAYFDAQYEMLVRVRPEVVGHMDVCRLFEPEVKLEEGKEVWERVTRNVKFAVEYGALFEVNAAAFKKGWASAYPGEDVLKVERLSLQQYSL